MTDSTRGGAEPREPTNEGGDPVSAHPQGEERQKLAALCESVAIATEVAAELGSTWIAMSPDTSVAQRMRRVASLLRSEGTAATLPEIPTMALALREESDCAGPLALRRDCWTAATPCAHCIERGARIVGRYKDNHVDRRAP